MEITRRSRTELKSYFRKNNIPTENNFADLIDGMLNQKEDGLVKLPSDPLCLEAAGDNASDRPVLHFYRNFQDPSPAWKLTLNPRSNPDDAGSARVAGLNLNDGGGKSWLFIDGTTGKVGVGTLTPGANLDIAGIRNTSGQVSLQLRSGNTSGNQDSNQITFGYNNTAQYRHAIKTRHHSGQQATNAIDFYIWKHGDSADTIGSLHAMTLDGGKVGIGTTGPGAKLEVAVAPDDTATTPLLVRKGPSPYLTVLNNGNLGIGTPDPQSKLVVAVAADDATTPLLVRKGPSPYLTVLNNGNLGIGTPDPQSKLVVAVAADDATTPLLVRKGPSPYLTVLNNGNLGIGTPNPVALLDVTATNRTGTGRLTFVTFSGVMTVTGVGESTKFTEQLRVGDTITVRGQTRRITSIPSDNRLGIDRPFDLSDYDIRNEFPFTFSYPPALVVTPRNVGIGTPNPGAKLEVMGDIKTDRGFATVANVAGVKIRFGSQELPVLVSGIRLDTVKHGETFSSPESYFVIAKVCEKHPTVGAALVTTYECRPLNSTEFIIRWGHNQNMNITAVVYYVVIGT